MEQYRACSKCKQVLPFSDFVKDKYKKSGITSDCKKCRIASGKKYRSYPENKKKIAATNKLWRDNNPETVRANNKTWSKRNPEQRKAINQKHRAANREKYRDRQKLYRQENPSARKDWAKRNPEKQQAIEFQRDKRARKDKNKISLREIQKLKSGPCFYCGSAEQIQIDHVVPLARGGKHSIGNLVSACKTCNMSKHAKFITEWKYKK